MAKKCNLTGCINPVFSHLYCKNHQHLRTDDKWLDILEKKKNKQLSTNHGQLKRTPIKTNYKPSGEGALFDTIIATRDHFSFISGLPIEVVDHSNCHHVLEKGRYPKFRLNFDNIVILTQREHYLIHHGTSEQRLKYVSDMFRDHGAIIKWSSLQYLKEKLIKEYGELKC